MGIVSLIGLMCSGKDTAGSYLAKRLDISFIATDSLIEREVGSSIAAYVSANGMPALRKVEHEQLGELQERLKGKSAVISVGGGAPAHDEEPNYSAVNAKILRTLGKVFYLSPSDDPQITVAILTERLKQDKSSKAKRPAMYREEKPHIVMRRMFDSRDERYKLAAHYTVYTGNDSPEAVARRIHVINDALPLR